MWQNQTPKWGVLAGDMASDAARPAGILGAHHVHKGVSESRKWRIDEVSFSMSVSGLSLARTREAPIMV